MTRQVAVASSSAVATDAATEIIELGGNAVDAAVAAAFVSINTEPGVCALAGGAYITLWAPDADPVCIDGYARIPGLGATSVTRPIPVPVHMDYGGGVTTYVGAGSVAVPGTPGALSLVHERYGQLPWRACLDPAIRICREGFPLPKACRYYLEYSGTSVFGRSDIGFSALHPDGERLAQAGERIVVEGLANTLETLADEGVASFYRGDIGRAIVQHVQAHGGYMTPQDLESFSPVVYPASEYQVGEWALALPPPPSIGGSVLGAMLQLVARGIDPVESMYRCLRYRREHMDFAEDLPAATEALLDSTLEHELARFASANTVHTSAADTDGLACAITASAGYGCGEIPDGTGLWLNNCLGEIELNRRGFGARPAGATLPTNMAPAAARFEQDTLAIGTPGADRITSAMLQTLSAFMVGGASLVDAIAAPRWHVEMTLEPDTTGYTAILHTEPGVRAAAPSGALEHTHSAAGMYFGGVSAAQTNSRSLSAVAVADPRRVGGTTIASPNTDV
ncbi:MAG: gamma-glutamyltransferase [Pseudomonadota bacterium]